MWGDVSITVISVAKLEVSGQKRNTCMSDFSIISSRRVSPVPQGSGKIKILAQLIVCQVDLE